MWQWRISEKNVAALITAVLKHKHLVYIIGWCMQMPFDTTSISLKRVYFCIINFCESSFSGRSVRLELEREHCILLVMNRIMAARTITLLVIMTAKLS